jgi:hypothetical protein
MARVRIASPLNIDVLAARNDGHDQAGASVSANGAGRRRVWFRTGATGGAHCCPRHRYRAVGARLPFRCWPMQE